MHNRLTIMQRVATLTTLLVVLSCSESVGPKLYYGPSFSFSPNGVTLNRVIGTLNESGTTLGKGFDAGNPHLGDAIIATFVWLSSTTTNIIDSVSDHLNDANFTPVGNQYTLVEFIHTGGISMATYVATNVRGFSDPAPSGGPFLAVFGHLSESVTDGGVLLTTFPGVEDAFAQALGAHHSAAASGTGSVVVAPGPLSVNAGALVYTVSLVPMSGLGGRALPDSFVYVTTISDNNAVHDAGYLVAGTARSYDPRWSYTFNSQSSALATVLSLNAAGGTSSPGNLTATTSTSGSNLDPDGYTVAVDGGTGQPIGINGSVTFSGLTAGSHTVALSGVAANCSVSGGPSQTVTVPSGGTATAAFTITCSATTGNLTVNTSTSGSSLDPDGYTVTVDGGSPQALGINASFTYNNLAAGNHTVAISGVAANCTVSGGNSQTATVPTGGTATATFTVTCSATTGNLTVNTSTSGSSLDPDGYTVTVDGGSPQALGINASFTYNTLAAGNHTVAISGVAANCAVSGGTSRTVSVPSGGTGTTTFTVTCVTPPGNLAVSTTSSGTSISASYTVTVDGSQSQTIASTGNVTFTNLSAASHTVVLAVPANCTVTGGASRTVTVPSGGTASVSYSVSCVTPSGNLAVSTSSSGANIPASYTVTVDGTQSQTIASTGNVTFTNLSAGSHTAVLAVPSNCTVSGGASRTVSVPSGGTANLSYSVSCNAPPVVNAGPDQTAVTGLLFSEQWSFTDANHNGPWTYTINWGDGSTSTGTASSEGTFSNGHTYLIVLPRSFTITVTVKDAAGATASETKIVSVLLL